MDTGTIEDHQESILRMVAPSTTTSTTSTTATTCVEPMHLVWFYIAIIIAIVSSNLIKSSLLKALDGVIFCLTACRTCRRKEKDEEKKDVEMVAP